MKKRDRSVPPPPPACTLPAHRPRRLDVANFNFRHEPRTPARLPAPPREREWFDGEPQGDHECLLGSGVDGHLLDEADPLANIPSAAQEEAKWLNVPMICAGTDRPFIVVFRETQTSGGAHYKLDRVRTAVGDGGEPAASISVPISSLDWSGVECPHCRSRCRPVHCGSCQRLACDAKVKDTEKGLFFACASSCGTSGYVGGSLRIVTGSESCLSAPGGFDRAPSGPKGVLRLPKPR